MYYWAEINLEIHVKLSETKLNMGVKQPLRWAFPVVTSWAPLDQMPNANASIINLTVSYKLSLFMAPIYKR